MNETGGAVIEKPEQPPNDEDDRNNIKYTSHKCFSMDLINFIASPLLR
jgi:hypothetical protein